MSSMPSSIYIARMSSFVTEENIRRELASLGKIIRVDFTPIGKKPGFVENLASNIKSAFVHFEGYLNHTNLSLSIANHGSVKMYPSFLYGSEYWILRTIHTPIQETMMNNAQIVENCRFLENKIEEQAATIKAMEEKLEGVHRVVYQLLGGLFNQQSQGFILNDHLKTLFNEKHTRNEAEEDTGKWTIWPTTRQGDENADRIAVLESQIQAMTDFNICDPFLSQDADEEKQDSNSVSTHTSMYDLVGASSDSDNNSVSTHSSMPDLVAASDSISEGLPDLIGDSEDEDSVDARDRDRLHDEEYEKIQRFRAHELGWEAQHFFQ